MAAVLTVRHRILVLSDLWQPFPGGAERLMFNVARHLHHRADCDVQVLTGYEYADAAYGPPVHIDLDMPLDDTGAQRVARFAADFRPDIVLTHHVYAHAFDDLLRQMPVPVVQFVLNGRRLDHAALAVYISDWVRTRHNDAWVNDVTMLPPAFDDVVAANHPGRTGPIGFVKPLPHKGADLVYRIAERMPERQFIVLRGEWQTLEVVSDLANVAYMEPVVDMRDFWSQVGIVLAPSISEDAGTIGQEAAANRVPCLSSKAGGLVETNAGGIRLPTTRVDKWVRTLHRLTRSEAAYRSAQDSQAAWLRRYDFPQRMSDLCGRITSLAAR